MSTQTLATANALYRTGRWLLDQQRHDDALHVFRTMLAVAPSDERGWLGLAACHEERGEADRADALYALAPSACGGALRCLVARARLRGAAGDEAEARALYGDAAAGAAEAGDDDVAMIVRAEWSAS